MGDFSWLYPDPRYRALARGRADRRQAQARQRPERWRGRLAGSLIAVFAVACAAWPATAETTLRIATLHTELSRKGPGLLLRDILRAEDDQVDAVVRVVSETAPDILILQGVDYDRGLRAAMALRDEIARAGPRFGHVFALRPNTGMASGLDLDGDGRRGEPEDAQGYGWFAGEGGMAILSRYPVETDAVEDFSALLWADLPGAIPPAEMAPDVLERQRLSSVAHWVVPVRVEGQILRLLVFHAGPPVFDGPEDRNGRRNHDQIVFWRHYLDGAFGKAPVNRFVIAGDANLDPVDGDGRKAAIRELLTDPRLQDPMPHRAAGAVAQGPGHRGDPALDTVAWPEPEPGHLRVSYILPSADLEVTGSGVYWPPGDSPEGMTARMASRHKLVWVDLVID